MTEDLFARIDRLEARVLIAELVARYCKACDDRDIPLLRSLFVEDAVFESADGVMRATGLDAILAMYRNRFEVLGISVHWTHDHIIRLDPSDRDAAEGEIFGHAEAHRNGRTLIASMRYHDRYRRTSEGWKFCRRRLLFCYYVPVDEYAEALGSRLRQRAYDEPRLADYPETLPSWEGWRAYFGAA